MNSESSREHSKHRLDLLFTPRTSAEFRAEHESRRPWLITRDTPDLYDRLIDVADVDDVISVVGRIAEERRELPPPMQLVGGEMMAGTVAVPRLTVGDIADVPEAYHTGSTVVIPNVHKYWASLQALCDDLETEFRAPVRTTLFHSPPAAQAFPRHMDPSDSMVLQLRGEKRWRVTDSGATEPLYDLPKLPFESERTRGQRLRAVGHRGPMPHPVVLIDAVLRPGDLLYIPAGFDHEVWTLSSVSTHVTVGFEPVTYSDLLLAGLRQFAAADGRCRRRIFIRHDDTDAAVRVQLDELVSSFVESFDTAAAFGGLAGAFNARQQARQAFLSCLS